MIELLCTTSLKLCKGCVFQFTFQVVHVPIRTQCVKVCCRVLQRVAVWWSVLQYVGVCCGVLQSVAVCYSVLQCAPDDQMNKWQPCKGGQTLQNTESHCTTLQHTATHCNTLQHIATCCNSLQNSATHCNTLQHTTSQCNSTQHTATHCSTLQYTAANYNTLKRNMIYFPFILFCIAGSCSTV